MRPHLPMTNQGVTWICHLSMARWPPHATEKRNWPTRPKNVCAAFQHTKKCVRRKYSGTLFQYALDFNRGGQDHTLRQSHYYRHKVPQSIFQLVISHLQTASLAPPLMSLSSVPLSLPASNISLDAAAEDVSLGAAVLRAAVGVSIIVDASS